MFSQSKDVTCSKPESCWAGFLDTSSMGPRPCYWRYTALESIHGQLPETEQKTAPGAIKDLLQILEREADLLPTGLFGLRTLLEHSLPALNILTVSETKARLLCSIRE